MTKQFTPDLKLKAVNYYHKINNYVKVCEVFECSERSLKRWVERYDIRFHPFLFQYLLLLLLQ